MGGSATGWESAGVYGKQGCKVQERGGEKIVINNGVRSGKKVVFLQPEV